MYGGGGDVLGNKTTLAAEANGDGWLLHVVPSAVVDRFFLFRVEGERAAAPDGQAQPVLVSPAAHSVSEYLPSI